MRPERPASSSRGHPSVKSPERDLKMPVPAHDDQVFNLVVRGISVEIMNLRHHPVPDAGERATIAGFLTEPATRQS